MRTSNPAFGKNIFDQAAYAEGNVMTVQGTVNSTLILLGLAFASAWWVWGQVMQPVDVLGYQVQALAQQNQQALMPVVMGGAVIGFIAALITIFKKSWAPVTAPVYALAEGLFLGGLSGILEMAYPGIVIQAIGLTFGTLFCLLMAYKARVIRVTEKFRAGVVAATGAIALLYFVSFVMSFFGARIPFIHEGGLIGIGFSLFVVGIAAMNLVLDFDMIEQGAEAGAPKYMEWYGAFGLLVTLVWLYLEILKLLAKLRGRD